MGELSFNPEFNISIPKFGPSSGFGSYSSNRIIIELTSPAERSKYVAGLKLSVLFGLGLGPAANAGLDQLSATLFLPTAPGATPYVALLNWVLLPSGLLAVVYVVMLLGAARLVPASLVPCSAMGAQVAAGAPGGRAGLGRHYSIIYFCLFITAIRGYTDASIEAATGDILEAGLAPVARITRHQSA